MSLFSIQKIIQDAIISSSLDDIQKTNIDHVLEDKEALTASECLNIYREMFFIRVWDSLLDDYPMTVEIIGDDAFEDICMAYITDYPSKSYTLEDLGNHFLDFMMEKGHQYCDVDYLIDVIRYEKSVKNALHSYQEVKIGESMIDPERVDQWMEKTLTLASHVSLLDLSYDISELIEFLESSDPISSYKIKKNKKYMIIYSNCDQVFTSSIDAHSFYFLQCLKNNSIRPLEDIIGNLIDQTDEGSLLGIMKGFTSWISAGIVVERKYRVLKKC